MFAASTAYSSTTFYKWKAKYGGLERAQTTVCDHISAARSASTCSNDLPFPPEWR